MGGGEGYYNRFLSRPTWPGFASGCTIGLGYDTCFNSKQVILFDWNKLPERFRIAEMSGIGGEKAKIKLPEIRDIVIKWGLAEEVFNNTTVTKFWGLCRRTYPGFDELHPNAQAALLSLTFNRGNSMAGPKRVEMRAIRDLTAKKKYQEIADQIRKMKAIWRGTDIQKGMERRRDAEARLMETAK